MIRFPLYRRGGLALCWSSRFGCGSTPTTTMNTPDPNHPTSPPADNYATSRKRWPKLGFRWLYVADALTLFGLMSIITTVRFGFDWPSYPVSHYAAGFAAATALHMAVYYFGGLYEYAQRLGRPPQLPRAVLLTLIAAAVDGSVALLADRYLMPRGNLVLLIATGSLLLVVNRRVARRVRLWRYGNPRVLLAGHSDDTARARQHLLDSEPDAIVAGSTDCDPSTLAAETKLAGATDVLLLSSQPLESVYPEPLGAMERKRVGVYKRVTPADTLLGLQRTRQIGGMPFVALRVHALPRCRLRFKRLLDLMYLLALAPVAVPLAATVAVWVRIRAGSGVIYRQQRVGLGGQVFVMLKFRTMSHDAESQGRPMMASRNDPRVVRGLGWLRRTRLDELPQLWNVLGGMMSLVGPRPERPELVVELSERIGGYNRRHDVPPGVTGLAQTQGHYQTDAAYKLGHDLQYIVNWSPVLDWEIMAKSLIVMVRGSAR